MNAQIDFTAAQSRAHSKQIEATGPTEAEIDYQALQVMRGLSSLDMSEALHDALPQIKLIVMQGSDPRQIGQVVQASVQDYCRRIACRMLEAE